MGDKTSDISLNFVSSSTASPVPCGAPALASDACSHPSAGNAKFMGSVAVGTSNAIDPLTNADRLARPEALLHRQIEVRETIMRVGMLELDLIERTARRHERTIDAASGIPLAQIYDAAQQSFAEAWHSS